MTYDAVKREDPEIYASMMRELQRQRDHIELIASENFVTEAVMEAMGSHLTNKYAEGYPGARYYGGCEYVDEVERIAIDRAKKIFGAEHANVQPHSGSQANMAVYLGLLKPGDTILGMDLSNGGLYEFEDLWRGIARVIGESQPQLIFAPDPDVNSECHADHRNVGEAAKRAACFAPYRALSAQYGADAADVKALAFYMTAKPNRFVKTRGFLKLQQEAILCHPSQFVADSQAFRDVALYLKLRAADFGLHAFCTQAEGFRVLGQTQMHCLPEAGL